MKMEICDNDSNCCQTADNLHYKFGDDRKRGSIDVYADVDLLGNCDNVGSTFKKKTFLGLLSPKNLGHILVHSYNSFVWEVYISGICR